MNRTPGIPRTHSRSSLWVALGRRAFLLPACGFVVGILLQRGFPGWTVVVAISAAAMVVLISPIIALTHGWKPLLPAVTLLAMTCGYLRADRRNVIASDDVSRLVSTRPVPLRVRGTIASRPQYVEQKADHVFTARDVARTTFDFRVDEVLTTEGWEPASGFVRVSVRDRASDFAYGDRAEFLGIFSRPRGPGGPGQFDYAQYLRRQGILLTASLPSRESLGRPLIYHQGNLFREIAFGLSARCGRVIDRLHSPAEAGLLKCILLGEREAIDPETAQTFRMAGLSHLLAVSGLHVVILVGGLWLVLRFIGVPERVIAVIATVLAITYAGMADFRPSVVRAAIAVSVVALGRLPGRRPDMLNLLSLAALVVLIANPDQVFTAGFQLSFAAVLGLVGLTRHLSHHFTRTLSFNRLDVALNQHRWSRVLVNDRMATMLAISIPAWLATVPLIAWHFNVISIITPLANLVMIPLFAAVLFAGFGSLLVATFAGLTSAAAVSGALAWAMMAVSHACSRLPFAWINVPSPPAALLVAYYVLLVLVFAAPALGMSRRRPAIAMLVVLCVIASTPLWPSAPEHAELAVLDVGMGSAAVVRSPGGRTALIDAGSMTMSDVSNRTIVPYLARSGVTMIDVVLLSHPDIDHVSGLPMLLSNVGVKKVLLGEDFKYSAHGAHIERFLAGRGVDYDYVALGDTIDLDGVTLQVIHPPDDPHRLSRWSPNEGSAVVRGVTPGGVFLLPGDVSARGLHDLCAAEDLSADVLLAAHHGGYSGMERLARDYRWPVVLFSARKGFIDPERFAAYRRTGGRTYTTWECGTIEITFADEVKVRGFRRRDAE